MIIFNAVVGGLLTRCICAVAVYHIGISLYRAAFKHHIVAICQLQHRRTVFFVLSAVRFKILTCYKTVALLTVNNHQTAHCDLYRTVKVIFNMNVAELAELVDKVVSCIKHFVRSVAACNG